jgi:cytosine permease
MNSNSGRGGDKELVLEAVPESKKTWIWPVLFIAASYCLAPETFLTAGIMTSKAPGWWVMAGFAIGGTIATFLLAPSTAWICCKKGITIHVMLRKLFGKGGFILPDFGLVTTRIGWSAFPMGMIGLMFVKLTNIGYVPACIIIGVLTIAVTIQGFAGLKWVSYIGVPAMLIVFLTGFFLWNKDASFGPLMTQVTQITTEKITWVGILSGATAYWAAGIVPSGDWFRYSRKKSDVFVSLWIATVPLTLITVMIGAFGALSVGNWDVTVALEKVGLAIPALIAMLIAGWTTINGEYYSSSLGMTTWFNKPKLRIPFVVLSGVIGTFLAATKIYEHVLAWLGYIGAMIGPIAGIAFAEFFLLKHDVDRERRYIKGIYLPSIIAWVCGVAVGLTVKWGIGIVNVFVVSMIIYYIVSLLYDKNGRK